VATMSSRGTPTALACGDRIVAAILIRFDDHDEVGVCFGCVDWLNNRSGRCNRGLAVRPLGIGGDRCRTASVGSTDAGRPIMAVGYADCRSLVERGAIVRP
jgi:hypothetical protein